MDMPSWALALTDWIHTLATLLWLGSLAFLSKIVIPAMQYSLDTKTRAKLTAANQKETQFVGMIRRSAPACNWDAPNKCQSQLRRFFCHSWTRGFVHSGKTHLPPRHGRRQRRPNMVTLIHLQRAMLRQ